MSQQKLAEHAIDLAAHHAALSMAQQAKAQYLRQGGENTAVADVQSNGSGSDQQQPPPLLGSAYYSPRNILSSSSHPVALVFHLLFKFLALMIYLFCYLFTASFVLTFVLVVLMSAFDFWTVKNITGRLLVGLRWWNEMLPDGTNKWLFENNLVPHTSQKVPSVSITHVRAPPNMIDYRIFWWSSYIYLLLWLIWTILSLLQLHFQWLLIDLVTISMTLANLYGYIKCDRQAKKEASTGESSRDAFMQFSSFFK